MARRHTTRNGDVRRRLRNRHGQRSLAAIRTLPLVCPVVGLGARDGDELGVEYVDWCYVFADDGLV